jgi:Uma2 family endonuclease
MPVSEATYEQLALEDLEGRWEYLCGQIRQKPPMTHEHEDTSWWLAHLIQNQLDRRAFQVRHNGSRTHRPNASYFIPDVMVVPFDYFTGTRGTGQLESFEDPLPFVAEVWSRSTGGYDVDTKFEEYKKRGDREIWRVHPYERSVTAWRRQTDGSYAETHYSFTDGEASISWLPGVSVRFKEIFE